MSLFSAFAVYFIIWWLTLFMVLPFGVHNQVDEGEIVQGTEPGAPHRKNPLFKKLIINSFVAALVFGIFWYITGPLGYTFDDIPKIVPEKL